MFNLNEHIEQAMTKKIEDINLEAYSIEDLHHLMDKAQKEIGQKEKTRIQDVRSEMQRLASTVGMTPEAVLEYDARKKKSAKLVGKVKYQNPNDPSQTWSGRGKRPRWLQGAIEQGAELSQFAVDK